MKVRIKATPLEHELDGIRLDRMNPGMVREVSPSIGSWLIVQGYAELEMRTGARVERGADRHLVSFQNRRHTVPNCGTSRKSYRSL